MFIGENATFRSRIFSLWWADINFWSGKSHQAALRANRCIQLLLVQERFGRTRLRFTPASKRHDFAPARQTFTLNGERTNADFFAATGNETEEDFR